MSLDPENDQFPRGPNDTFPIISSTGSGGEGCRIVGESKMAVEVPPTPTILPA
jgi:hypothetical protein